MTRTASLINNVNVDGAHASQIPETSSAMRLDDYDFSAVDGYEWFTRRGPEGPIEMLPRI